MRIKKRVLQKMVSVFASILLLVNSFTPYLLIAPSFSQVKAQTETVIPTQEPIATPTEIVSPTPTAEPTLAPTSVPTEEPTAIPTLEPTSVPTVTPEPIRHKLLHSGLLKK